MIVRQEPTRPSGTVPWLFLLGAWLWAAGLAVLLVTLHSAPTPVRECSALVHGRPRCVTFEVSSGSVYDANPGPVRILLLLVALACLTATVSLVVRWRRRTGAVGVASLVAAGVVLVVGLLGALTIGVAVLPLAGLLAASALRLPPGPMAPRVEGSAPWLRGPSAEERARREP